MISKSFRFEAVRKTHDRRQDLDISQSMYAKEVSAYFSRTLASDLGKYGDITSKLLLLKNAPIKAKIIAKSKGILAGVQEINFFLKNKTSFRFQFLKKDGDSIAYGDEILQLEGKALNILEYERTILNLLQRLSGVATLAKTYKEKAGNKVLVVPTRKTLLGALDKRACTLGGCGTHRLSLNDAILVKDTHLDILGHNFQKLFKLFSRKQEKGHFIEVEVENTDEALALGNAYQDFQKTSNALKIPFFIMFDNMKPQEIHTAINQIKKLKNKDEIFFEASGGINLKNINLYAKSGVDVISVGALTHSAQALDFSLKIITTNLEGEPVRGNPFTPHS